MGCKGVYPGQYFGGSEIQHQASQFLCLDLLLAFVNDMTLRAEGVCVYYILRLEGHTNEVCA
jgi:hypothetical protein